MPKRRKRSTLDAPTWYQREFEKPAREAQLRRKAEEEKRAYLRKLEEWEKHPKMRYVDLLTGKEVKGKARE